MADRIQLRRDTAANWTAYNPILLEGEPGIELDTDQWKLGDGIHTWSQLAYRGGECVQQRGQSTTVAMSQKAVTDELDAIDATFTKQTEEFTVDDFTIGGYYRNTGEYVSTDSRHLTDFISVKEGDICHYKIYQGNPDLYTVIAFDSSKTLIPASSITGVSGLIENDYTVPSGVSYLRFCEGGASTHTAEVLFANSLVDLNKKLTNLQSQVGDMVSSQYLILPFVTDAATTRLQIPADKRKQHLIISYNNGLRNVTEKRIRGGSSDASWSENSAWSEELFKEDYLIIESALKYNGIDNLFKNYEYGRLNENGNVVQADEFITSDYIDVTSYTKLYIKSTVVNASAPSICCYDANKSLISNASVLDSFDGWFNIPSGVSFIKVSGRKYYDIGVFINSVAEIAKGVCLTEQDIKIIPLGNNLANPDYITDRNINLVGSINDPAATGWKMISIPVKSGDVITFGNFTLNRSAYCAFYNDNGIVGEVISYGDPATYGAVTVTAPEGSTILHIDIKTAVSQDSDYEQIMINYGNTLLPYEPYKDRVSKIKNSPVTYFNNEDTLNKFSESNGKLQWNGSPINSDTISTLVTDLPVGDGTGIESGYAYIDSTDRTIKVKA